MLYHKKKKTLLDKFEPGAYMDSDGNYYRITTTIEHTSPDFFNLKDEDSIIKLGSLGYSGPLDICDIRDWFRFAYKIEYSEGIYQGFVFGGRNSDLLEAKIRIDGVELTNYLSISVKNIDERSTYVLMKEAIQSMICFFEVHDGKVIGPSTRCFENHVKGNSRWD